MANATFTTIAPNVWKGGFGAFVGPNEGAEAGILGGMVVGLQATGVENEFAIMNNTAAEVPIGFAGNDAGDGDPLTVYGPGNVCIGANCVDGATIDAGHWLYASSGVAGSLVSYTPTAQAKQAIDGTNDYITVTDYAIIGMSLQDFASGATTQTEGKVLVQPFLVSETTYTTS